METNIKSVGISASKVGPTHSLRAETTFHGLLLSGSITHSFEQYICTANVNTCGLIDNDEAICAIQYDKEKERFYKESGLVAKDNALNMMMEKYFDSQNTIEREDVTKKNMSDFNRLATDNFEKNHKILNLKDGSYRFKIMLNRLPQNFIL